MSQSSTSPENASAKIVHYQKQAIIAWTAAATLTVTVIFVGVFLLLAKPHAPNTTAKVQTSPGNPFATKRPTVAFPLYYSKTPPAGYIADQNSITEPHDGVILYNLLKGKDKIVVTEEARTDKLVNLGAFYEKLKDSKQIVVSDGSIATGYFGSTRVASRANNHTWILVTTTADVSFDDLTAMLKNITSVQ